MSDLRHTFNVLNGVPTAVDVFFSVRSLSKNLDVVMKKIQDSKGYTNKIVQHSQVIYNIEDIVDLYSKLQNNNLIFEQFGQSVDKYLRTITTTLKLKNRLKKMILGQGILDNPGRDIFNSYISVITLAKMELVVLPGTVKMLRVSETSWLTWTRRSGKPCYFIKSGCGRQKEQQRLSEQSTRGKLSTSEIPSKVANRSTVNTGSLTAVTT